MTTIAPFPLQWPTGRPRRRASDRRTGRFTSSRTSSFGRQSEITIAGALDRLFDELKRIDAKYVVVSSNLEARKDGLPYSGQREPDDPGVAVYFHLLGKPTCLPCDTYTKVAQNIAAVAAHIEATRAIERHGVASVAEMFSGFTQLPPAPHWSEILEVSKTARRPDIEAAYRSRARTSHPDAGGSHDAMAALNAARDRALKEIGQ